MLKEIIERVQYHMAIGEKNIYLELDEAKYLLSLISRMRECLERIEKWDFDIMGDCVADAQKLAGETLKETE